MDDKNTLAHTSWRCKYHIVFEPKYRRKEIYGNYQVKGPYRAKINHQLSWWL